MAVLDAIATAYLDRERARLGLPSRRDLEEKRALEARAAAESASRLESADLLRQKMQAEIAALPAEQALDTEYKRSQIERNLREPQPRAEPSSMLERIMAMPPEQQAAALKLHRELNPRPEGGSQPRTGWQPQYDAATGRLMGYYHPATETFRAAGEGALPGGMRPSAVPAGEMEKRGGLQAILSDVGRLRELAAGPAGKSIGYYSGRMQDVRASGAVPLLDPPSDEYMELTHIADNVSDMLLRARSGAQINEQEYARLRKITPNPRTSPEKFAVDLDRFEIELQNILAARQGQPLTQTAPPAQTGATTTVNTAAEYNALPSGTIYFTPDGKRKRKP